MTDDKSPGIDNLDGKLLKMTAKYISKPLDWACAEIWKEAKVIPRLSQGYPKVIPRLSQGYPKVIPLPKDKRKTFAGSNSRPISLLPVLSQIQYYFASNNLTRNYQPAYRDGHSTSTALAQMTDDWFRSTDDRRLVGAVMLDFSAASDVIDHSLLLNKLKCYGFGSVAMCWMESYLTRRRQRVFFNGSFSESKVLECGLPQFAWAFVVFYIHK